jgi:multicomponent Na+:H+ antiporter subunit E
MKILQAALLVLVFWMVLAAPLGWEGLLWGLPVAVLIGVWTATRLWALETPGTGLRRLAGLLAYTLDLLRSIIPAAVQVTGLILKPTLQLDPIVIRHRMRSEDELSRVALANAITLTPGTHCVDMVGDELIIHCLEPHFAEPVADGRLEARIATVLGTGNKP